MEVYLNTRDENEVKNLLCKMSIMVAALRLIADLWHLFAGFFGAGAFIAADVDSRHGVDIRLA